MVYEGILLIVSYKLQVKIRRSVRLAKKTFQVWQARLLQGIIESPRGEVSPKSCPFWSVIGGQPSPNRWDYDLLGSGSVAIDHFRDHLRADQPATTPAPYTSPVALHQYLFYILINVVGCATEQRRRSLPSDYSQ